MEKGITLGKLMCELKRELLSYEQSDDKRIAALGYIFSIVEDLERQNNNSRAANIALHLYEGCRDLIERESWKSKIPEDKQILQAFD